MSKLFYTRLAVQNLKKNSAVTIPWLLTCIGSVMMYYIISSLTVNPGFAHMQGGGSMVFILLLGCVVMAVFSFLFLIYTNSFLVKRRKQEFGLFQVLGMGKKHLARIMALETLITAAVSLVAGVALGFFAVPGLCAAVVPSDEAGYQLGLQLCTRRGVLVRKALWRHISVHSLL